MSLRSMALSFVLVLAVHPAMAFDAWQTLSAVPDKPQAPDFNLPDMNGKQHRLSDYRGKVVIVSFWATWCDPCRDEMPSMQQALDKLGADGLAILGIDIGEQQGAVRQFSQSYSIKFPLLLDPDSTMTSQWPLRGVPTSFVVDAQGHIAYIAVGGRDWDHPTILAELRELLKWTNRVIGYTR
jgi:peroxiredoxin